MESILESPAGMQNLQFDPSHSGNRILQALPAAEWERLEPYLMSVEWPLGALIQEVGSLAEYVAFPQSGLLSASLVSQQNVEVEVSMAGAEGQMGAQAILEDIPSMVRATVQVAGRGLLLPDYVLREEWERGGTLRCLLLLHNQVSYALAAQSALCNRLHTTEERLSRWLLQVQDLLGGNSFALTNSFIATMLGIRLSGVAVALGSLEQSGIIRHTSEAIVIVDRSQLKESACECYPILRARQAVWDRDLEEFKRG